MQFLVLLGKFSAKIACQIGLFEPDKVARKQDVYSSDCPPSNPESALCLPQPHIFKAAARKIPVCCGAPCRLTRLFDEVDSTRSSIRYEAGTNLWSRIISATNEKRGL